MKELKTKKSPQKKLKKSSTFKSFKIEEEMFNARFFFCVGDSKSFNKFLTKHNKPTDTLYAGKYLWYEDGMMVLWIQEPAVDLLFHEILHLVTSVLDSRGIPISHENDEVMAYYSGLIYKAIVKKTKLRLK